MTVFKYWNVIFDNEECSFSQDKFKTKNELAEYLYINDLCGEPDNINEFELEYELKSTNLLCSQYNTLSYKCPYCGRKHVICREEDKIEYMTIEKNFEYFGMYETYCHNRKCNKLFILRI